VGDELCDTRHYSAPRRLVASAMQEVYGQRKNKPQPSNNYAICLNGSDSSLGSNIVLVTMASKPNSGSYLFTIRFACQPSFKGDRSYSTLPWPTTNIYRFWPEWGSERGSDRGKRI
jgi:hypothetical protein